MFSSTRVAANFEKGCFGSKNLENKKYGHILTIKTLKNIENEKYFRNIFEKNIRSKTLKNLENLNVGLILTLETLRLDNMVPPKFGKTFKWTPQNLWQPCLPLPKMSL